ncbi:YraN family protein [Candidatus Chlorohelix allophototropha]|uniref:UPF0102 protein OZ401_000119 n=2 Tax=Candidatus Chlorohelix allophototropha TaxID=3003348 RepID=A0ABY9B176_9CHLR|nr:YraN family protein [Chloroflexota bacterium L227-S17]
MDMHLPDSKARKKLGDLGERLASEKLAAVGYKIIEANWRCRYGEFDLVAWHGKCLVFVEVRTRRGDQSGSPEESLTPRKLRTLHLLGDLYLQAHPELYDEHGEPPECRYDLVAVQFNRSGLLERLEVVENILEG